MAKHHLDKREYERIYSIGWQSGFDSALKEQQKREAAETLEREVV